MRYLVPLASVVVGPIESDVTLDALAIDATLNAAGPGSSMMTSSWAQLTLLMAFVPAEKLVSPPTAVMDEIVIPANVERDSTACSEKPDGITRFVILVAKR